MEEVKVVEAFGKLKPLPCVFVVSVDGSGKPSGMVAGWNMRCSADPPLFAVSLSKGGYTHKLVRESREFVVAFPSPELEEEVRFFGSTHGNLVDKFGETKIEIVKSKYVKSPIIAKAAINFECKLVDEVEAGDHIVFIGEILASYIDESRKVLFNLGKDEAGKRVFREYL